jgi:DNA modification methylase
MLDFGYYNMDCMAGMREFPDGYFELAIVDPPYGINVASHVNGALIGGGGGDRSAVKLHTVYGASTKALANQNPTTPSRMTARPTKVISESWRE